MHTSVHHILVDGNELAIEINQKMINSVNGHRLIIATIADITEKEHRQHELEKAKEKAEQSDKLKSSFLANMSHEIRTPLNAIVGFSALLTESENDEEKREYKNIISTNSGYLLRLINDILDLSKIDAGIINWQYESFDIADVTNELYTIINAKIDKTKVRLIVDNNDKSCVINLDKNRLKQVWINFLTNAVKYTTKGYIKFGYKVIDNKLRIYVTDTGVGIPEASREKVFDRFEKLDEFVQGKGLGLSICKALVDNINGEIDFDSTPGVGSTFWAIMPLGQPSIYETKNQPEGKPKPIDTTLEQAHILIAEDNDSNFMLMKHLLKAYRITRAVNGAEAVEFARRQAFSFVLMDIKMPVMTGIEATKIIRTFNTQIPIIAVTANAFDSDRDDALAAGCNEVLTKPLQKERLFEILNFK